MNKKTILALAAFVAAGSALATVESENTLCRIALTMTTKEAVIGLPLVDVGGSSESIKVTDFVLTDGLFDGTTLEYKDGDTWKGWVKNSSGAWESAKTANGSGAGENVSLSRGRAVLLTRPENDNASTRTVYLYGQVSGETPSISPVSGYNLLGNPGTEALTSASDLKTVLGFDPQSGDQVIVPTVWQYTLKGTEYYAQIFTYHTYDGTNWDNAFTIPAGQGFWYKKATAQ